MDNRVKEPQDKNFSPRINKTRNSLAANGPPEFIIKSHKTFSMNKYKS